MKKKRFSEAQVLNVLKEYEAGVSAIDLSRKYGIGESTIYAWQSKYAGMDLSELKRLRQFVKLQTRSDTLYLPDSIFVS